MAKNKKILNDAGKTFFTGYEFVTFQQAKEMENCKYELESFGFSKEELEFIVRLFSPNFLKRYSQYTKEDFIKEIKYQCQGQYPRTPLRYKNVNIKAMMDVIRTIMANEKNPNIENIKLRKELEDLGLSNIEINRLLSHQNNQEDYNFISLRCKVALLRMGFSQSESCYLLNSMYETLLEEYSKGTKDAFIADIKKKSMNYPNYILAGLMDRQLLVKKVKSIMDKACEVNFDDIHYALTHYGFSGEEIDWLFILKPEELDKISRLTLHEILFFIRERGPVYLTQEETVNRENILNVIAKVIEEYESNKSSIYIERDNNARNYLEKQNKRRDRIGCLAGIVMSTCILVAIGAFLENARIPSAGGFAAFLYIFVISIVVYVSTARERK